MANLSSMSDKVHMQRIHPLRRNSFCEDRMSFISRNIRSNQSEPLACSPYMSIDGQSWPAKVKHQNASGCFRPYPWKLAQIVPRLFRSAFGEFVREVCRQRFCSSLLLLLFGERQENILNAWSLDVCQPARANSLCYFI